MDPDNSTAITKQLVALVVGHELAHQWFGNLVGECVFSVVITALYYSLFTLRIPFQLRRLKEFNIASTGSY